MTQLAAVGVESKIFEQVKQCLRLLETDCPSSQGNTSHETKNKDTVRECKEHPKRFRKCESRDGCIVKLRFAEEQDEWTAVGASHLSRC